MDKKKTQLIEVERKYLLKSVSKMENWDKEFIIYQWFEKVNEWESIKLKIVFDLIALKRIVVRVTKTRINDFISSKEVEYLDMKDIDFGQYIGTGCIIKRRSISDKIFLDYFYKSNKICEYLLEIEDDVKEVDLRRLGVEIDIEVSEKSEYLNANMCIPFQREDYKILCFLIQMIPGGKDNSYYLRGKFV